MSLMVAVDFTVSVTETYKLDQQITNFICRHPMVIQDCLVHYTTASHIRSHHGRLVLYINEVFSDLLDV